MKWLLFLPLIITGCGDSAFELEPPDVLPATGRQYVVNRILLGDGIAGAYENALDLDGDDRVDNALGQSIAVAYSNLGYPAQQDLDAAVAAGDMMHLLMIGEPSAESLDTARLFLGEDADGDPDNNFDGDAALAVRENAPLFGAAFGENAGSTLDYDQGYLAIENTLFGAVELPLGGVHLEATLLADGTLSGVLGGLVGPTDRAERLVPALTASIQADVERDCDGTALPECCTADTRGARFIALFDSDESCSLTSEEIRDNGLFSALVAPDIDSDDDGIVDSLSVGFGFTAVPARFDVPLFWP